jgi:hypothetical protein
MVWGRLRLINREAFYEKRKLFQDSMFLSDALLHGLISRIVPDDNLEEEVM